jgi:hypothetical protein
MSCVFQNIDPLSARRVWPAFVAGGGHVRRVKRGVGGGGQYFGRRKTQATALYSTYIKSSLLKIMITGTWLQSDISARNYRPSFAKTSPKRSFSMTEYERIGLVFTKTRVYKFGHRSIFFR